MSIINDHIEYINNIHKVNNNFNLLTMTYDYTFVSYNPQNKTYILLHNCKNENDAIGFLETFIKAMHQQF